MKKAIFTFVLVTVGLIAAAQPGSTLNLRVYGNSFFTIQLDQKLYQMPDRFYTIKALTPGTHFLKVIRHAPHLFGMTAREVFSGYMNVPFNSVMDAFVDRYSRLTITHVQTNYTENHYYHQVAPILYQPMIPQALLVMRDFDFEQLKNVIASKSFESTRMEIAKQAISRNYLTTAQVTDLLYLMTFDSSRLNLAIYAYGRTIDKQNYYQTYSVFTFNNSVDELVRYINHNG